MYAVIQTGGKQYRVSAGDVIKVEKLIGEAGSQVTFDQILLVGEGETAKIGTPIVAGAEVTTEIVAQARGPKLLIFKKRRRQNSRRKNGHRQDITILRVTGIKAA